MAARDIAAQMLSEIQKDKFSPVLLFKFEFDNGTLRLWNGLHDLDFNEPGIGINTYTGAANLLALSSIKETINLKADSLSVSLSGLDATLLSISLTEQYQGRPFTLWLGALDDSNILIPDPLLIFNGKMDVMTFTDDGVTGKIDLIIENELIALNRPNERRYNDKDQELDFPGDRFFEFVPSIQQKEIVLE